MIKFLLKGLLRDKSRSRMPVIIVAVGVTLCVFMHAYITGLMGDSIEMNARISTGHLKVVTSAYQENMSQMPVDLALVGTSELSNELKNQFTDITWVQRIQFGGLVDAPDENGETKSQGPAMGMGIDMFSGNSGEIERMNIEKSLVSGHLPKEHGEVLLSDQFAKNLQVRPGDVITLIGTTMNGAMSYYNFVVSGTVSFGVKVLDKGALIADISDVRMALDMQDAATEITGFFDIGYFDSELSEETKAKFEATFPNDDNDEFAPIMVSLKEQSGMGQMVDLVGAMGAIITAVFMLALSLVLWNAGLLGGIRRYGEYGIRLAMGEEKRHLYKTLISESVLIGVAGSVVGTIFGLFFAWLLQKYGINMGDAMKSTSIMMPTVLHARITPPDFYIGFVPGVISTVIGTALAGLGIYKRKTAQLFKELEV